MRLCREPERFARCLLLGTIQDFGSELAPSVPDQDIDDQTFQSVDQNRVLLPESFTLRLCPGFAPSVPGMDKPGLSPVLVELSLSF